LNEGNIPSIIDNLHSKSIEGYSFPCVVPAIPSLVYTLIKDIYEIDNDLSLLPEN
jgi:hypothetical protein